MIPIYIISAIAIITVTFLIVGGAYLWHYSLITKIDTLEQNQTALKRKIEKMQPKTTEDAVVETDEKEIEYPIMLTRKNINKYISGYGGSEYEVPNPPDPKKLFKETANTIVRYSNTKWGIEFEVPFNENWGDDQYQIEPFEESKDGEKVILFGKFVAQEGGYGREFIIYVKPYKSVDELIEDAKIEQGQSGDEGSLSPPVKKTINSHQIVEYLIHGLNDPYYKYIIGEKYNYMILHLPQEMSVDEDPDIRKIIKSIKFIK